MLISVQISENLHFDWLENIRLHNNLFLYKQTSLITYLFDKPLKNIYIIFRHQKFFTHINIHAKNRIYMHQPQNNMQNNEYVNGSNSTKDTTFVSDLKYWGPRNAETALNIRRAKVLQVKGHTRPSGPSTFRGWRHPKRVLLKNRCAYDGSSPLCIRRIFQTIR